MTLNLKKLKELHEAATPGKWELNRELQYSINSESKHVAMVSCHTVKAGDREENEANANLITEMRNQLPELISWAERALPSLKWIINRFKFQPSVGPGGWAEEDEKAWSLIVQLIKEAEGE